MDRRRIARWMLPLSLLVGLCACKGEEAPSSSAASSQVEEIDDPNWPAQAAGLELEEQPQRVVSLSPSLTELAYELEGEAQLVGVSNYCDYPAQVEDLPDCGSALLPDRGTLEELSPDLVLASAELSPEDTQWLEELGAQVLVLPRAESMEELGDNYQSLATALHGAEDGPALAQEVFGALEARYEAILEAAGTVETPVSGIYLRQAPLLMATGDTFEGTLLEDLGIQNDAADYTGWQYPQEQAVNLYPDLIFYDEQDISEDYFSSTQVYSTTDAYLNGRLYPVEAITLERQSARMFDTLEQMFQDAYPDIPLPSPQEAEEPGDDGEEEMLDLADATQVE